MSATLVIQCAALVFLFTASAFFSAAEAALISMSAPKTKHLMRKRPEYAPALSVWLKDPNRLLTTLLLGNNAINGSASALGAYIAMQVADLYGLPLKWVGTGATFFVIAVLIIFGEMVPKIWTIHHAERAALLAIGPVLWVSRLFKPLADVFIWLGKKVLRIFGTASLSRGPIVTQDEIKSLVSMGHEEGLMSLHAREMIHSVLDFGNLRVEDIMTPRERMESLPLLSDSEKMADLIVETGRSRVPIYKDRMDNIAGVIYSKDILNALRNRSLFILEDLLRPPLFVPKASKVSELLRLFKEGKNHMAIVCEELSAGEAHRVAGIVTLEDVLEEIVGDILDEYDLEEVVKERSL